MLIACNPEEQEQMREHIKEASEWISGIEPPKELLTATGTQMLEYEIQEQPKRLRELIHAYKDDLDIQAQLGILRDLASREGPVIFIGMGASFCSAISGSLLLQTNGRLAFAVDAGEWLHYSQTLWGQAALSVLLTTSGESAELVELCRQATAEKPLGLICNNQVSTCWNIVRHRLPILAGPEYGNATKSYTNATAASIILSSEILGIAWQQDADRVADIFATNLERVFPMSNLMEEFCRGAVNIEVIGRGAAYGGAMMSALCLREMSGRRAAAHTGAGFKHGPILDVDASHVAIIFALGRSAHLGVKLAHECNRRGGKVILVADEQHEAKVNLLPIELDAVPEPWEGITSLLVPQALTLAMVERDGCRLPPRFKYGLMEQ